jgi:hypothetical protein
MKRASSQIGESPKEDAELRAQWAEEFLEQGGFQHILSAFMQCSLPDEALEVAEVRS